MQGARRAAAQRGALTGGGFPAFVLAFGAAAAAGEAARAHLTLGVERVVIPDVLSLTLLHNTGVAFSLLHGLPPVVTIALALTVLGVAVYNRHAWPRTAAVRWGLGLVLGGAAANVVERLRFGYVIDYLDIHVWPVFNLADCAIVVGAGLLVLALLRGGER
jgi:signal peptidase II